MFSQAEENYLKSIYALQELHKSISTNLLAKKTNTKASSVTDMLKKLALKNLVVYKKYQGVYLTKAGKKIALKVVRKHRLWECFLVEKLDFKWDEVHEIAEQLEHVKSEELVDRLEVFLNFPKFDPHGDPIPNKKGIIVLEKTINLSKMKIGEQGIMDGLIDSSDDFLKYLNKKKLALKDTIKIIEIESFDASIHIEINGEQRLVISKKVAENLNIKM